MNIRCIDGAGRDFVGRRPPTSLALPGGPCKHSNCFGLSNLRKAGARLSGVADADGGNNWEVTNISDLIVDMGMVLNGKRIYWAKCNLGATTETDYGDYFSWGEITGHNEGKIRFKWETYSMSGGYNTSGATLEKEDDPAYAALGGKFRMPTVAERTELIIRHYAAIMYTDGYKGSGINGCEIQAGDSNKKIFFPAAGRFDGNSVDYGGEVGYYWFSATDDTDASKALILKMDARKDGNLPQYGSFYRYLGFSIRPVWVE